MLGWLGPETFPKCASFLEHLKNIQTIKYLNNLLMTQENSGKTNQDTHILFSLARSQTLQLQINFLKDNRY